MECAGESSQRGNPRSVKAYEYMNKFYIEEGNKRVSVLKYYDAVSVPGYVTRILPAKTDRRKKIKFIMNL